MAADSCISLYLLNFKRVFFLFVYFYAVIIIMSVVRFISFLYVISFS